MQVKLLLGDYAYLYHGDLILEEIHKQIQQLTKHPYTLKWRDSDDEMISVLRVQDLKQCIDITKSKQKKTTLRLFIYEKTSDSGQVYKQKQNMQQSGQFTPIYSDSITPQTQSQFFPILLNNNTSQQTFGYDNRDSQSKENNQPDISNFLPTNEKIEFCRKLVISKMEEFYPGMNEKILQEKSHPLDLLKTQSEFQFQTCGPQFKKNNSIQDQVLNRFHSKFQETQEIQIKEEPAEQFEETRTIKMQSFGNASELYMHESIPTKKIENIKDECSNYSEVKDEEEFFFCDYCSEQIPGDSQAYFCPECGDLHICIGCFDTFKDSVHFHKLIAKTKQS